MTLQNLRLEKCWKLFQATLREILPRYSCLKCLLGYGVPMVYTYPLLASILKLGLCPLIAAVMMPQL